MSVDKDTVNKIARLSRIAISDAEADKMVGELNGILAWVEQLGEVDVTGVEPMTAVISTSCACATTSSPMAMSATRCLPMRQRRKAASLACPR